MRWILGAALLLTAQFTGASLARADVKIVFAEQSHREPPKGAMASDAWAWA